eukprot:CFRG5603T1
MALNHPHQSDIMDSAALLSFAQRLILDKDRQCLNNCGFYGDFNADGFCSKCRAKRDGPGDVNESMGSISHVMKQNTTAHKYNTNPLNVAYDNRSMVKCVSERASTSVDSLSDVANMRVDESSPWDEFGRRLLQNIDSDGNDQILLATSLAQAAGSERISRWFQRLEAGFYGMVSAPVEDQPANTKEYFKSEMRRPEAQDIVLRTKSFIQWFVGKKELNPSEQSESLNDFIMEIEKRMRRHFLWANNTPREMEMLVEGMQRHVYNRTFSAVFCPPDDKLKDDALRRKCRSLGWVRCAHLANGDVRESCLEETSHNSHLFDVAKHELLRINASKPPEDKLGCILRCCQSVFHIAAPATIGADEFLPILIYVVIKANPPKLHSNLQYLSRYCSPRRLLSGEGGYFFTTLCCAVSFIDHCGPANLGVSEAEYERRVSLHALAGQYNQQKDDIIVKENIHNVKLKELKLAISGLVNAQAEMARRMLQTTRNMEECVPSAVANRTTTNARAGINEDDNLEHDISPHARSKTATHEVQVYKEMKTITSNTEDTVPEAHSEESSIDVVRTDPQRCQSEPQFKRTDASPLRLGVSDSRTGPANSSSLSNVNTISQSENSPQMSMAQLKDIQSEPTDCITPQYTVGHPAVALRKSRSLPGEDDLLPKRHLLQNFKEDMISEFLSVGSSLWDAADSMVDTLGSI